MKYTFASVIPIHKGKSKAEAKNYRTVALTSILIKIFEKGSMKDDYQILSEGPRKEYSHSPHTVRNRIC